MEMPEEMLNDPEIPQMTKDMFQNKLLIQWTDDLKKASYKNLGFYIHKGEMPELQCTDGEPMKEALIEFGRRIQIGAVLV